MQISKFRVIQCDKNESTPVISSHPLTLHYSSTCGNTPPLTTASRHSQRRL